MWYHHWQAEGLNVTGVLLYKLDYGPSDAQPASAAAAAPAPTAALPAAVPVPTSGGHGLPGGTVAGGHRLCVCG